MKKHISIVIPAYNEELVIPELGKQIQLVLKSLSSYTFEVIVVDNGSKDDTTGALLSLRKKDPRFKIVQLTKNEECDGGILAGLTFASGDAAIVMMADLQENPTLIPQFLATWESGYDIVYGIVKRRPGSTLVRKISTYIFYQIIHALTGTMVPRDVSDFRLMDRRAYQAIVDMPEHNKFFRGLSTWTAFRRIGIPFERSERAGGVSKADFKTAWTVAMNGITSFSYIPLRLPWMIAIFAVLASLCVFVSSAQVVIAGSLLLFSLLCIMMGIQNEYMIRVLEEVRGRPNFIIRKTFGLPEKTHSRRSVNIL